MVDTIGRKGFSPEQIIGKLRKAKVLLTQMAILILRHS